METIEHRIEATAYEPDYSGLELSEEEIAQGAHRLYVGGVWDTHGQKQLEYLIEQGLQPQHRLIDIGCGSFRAGQHFVDYLEPGHYYGVDANHSVMQAGYDVELTDEQRTRLPLSNLRANDRFDVDFGVQFDYALAQSVFTHVSLNHIRLCLYRAAKVVRPGGVFYATFFEHDQKTPVDKIFGVGRQKPLFTEKNVFWYYREDIRWASQIGPWQFKYIGDWGHPARQKMVQFTRLTDAEWAARKAARKAAAAAPAKAAPPPPPRMQVLVTRGRKWAARKLDPKR